MRHGQPSDLRRGYNAWLRRSHVQVMAGPLGFAWMNTPLVWRWRRLGLRPTDRVLDVGCGTGAMLAFLAARVKPTAGWHGVDVSESFLSFARRLISRRGFAGHIHFAAGSAQALPYADGSFEVVLSSHVLHHVPAEQLPGIFAEAYRVLRPGGISLWWAFDRKPIPEEQEKVLRVLGRARAPEEIMRNLFFHTRREIEEHLCRAGFQTRQLLLGRFLVPPVPRFSIAAVRPG
ncbi:MAG: class I SAM-dependent methyltransferase [Thermoanaerobaculia bacterium]